MELGQVGRVLLDVFLALGMRFSEAVNLLGGLLDVLLEALLLLLVLLNDLVLATAHDGISYRLLAQIRLELLQGGLLLLRLLLQGLFSLRLGFQLCLLLLVSLQRCS